MLSPEPKSVSVSVFCPVRATNARLFELLHLTIPIVFLSLSAHPAVQDQDVIPLFTQELLHFGDGAARLLPDGDGSNFALFDPAAHGQWVESQPLGDFS